MKKFVKSFMLIIMAFTVFLEPVDAFAESDGSWCKIYLHQTQISGMSAGCTFCTVYNIMQNSGTLKAEFQNPAGEYKSEPANLWSEAKKALWKGGMANQATSLDFYNDKTTSTWSGVSADTVGIKGASGTWSCVVGTQVKNFKDLNLSNAEDKAELIATMKSFWNGGYWVIVGLQSKSNPLDGNGPQGFRGKHWVMLSGVTDTDIYFNDSGNGSTTSLFTGKYNGDYYVAHVVLLKNSEKSLAEVATGIKPSATDEKGKTPEGAKIEATSTDEEAIQNMGITKKAFYGEEEVSSFCVLRESDVENLLSNATVDNLSGDDLESLDNWKNVVAEEDSGIFYWARIIMMLTGIGVIIWSVLFYVSFWFDRTNNFFEISLISILTLGRLRISDTEDSCTYGKANKEANKVNTVNHRAVIKITTIGIMIGSLIVSGLVYKLMQSLVNTILLLLGQISA